MNWAMIAVGVLQSSAGIYGFYIGQNWRINTMNFCVAAANILLAGA